MIYQKLSALGVALSLLLTGLVSAQPVADHAPAGYVFLLFGTEQTYATSLPLQGSHDTWQVIWEVELDTATLKTYLTRKLADQGQNVFTLSAEPLIMTALQQKLMPFQAMLYLGIPGQEGATLVAAAVPVRPTRAIFAAEMATIPLRPLAPKYVLFGNSQEQYLVHVLVTRPEFEQVMAVRINNEANLRLMQERGALLWQPGKWQRNKPLAVGKRLKGLVPEDGFPLQLDLKRDVYVNVWRLK